jgi:LacI family transcriptional regulator
MSDATTPELRYDEDDVAAVASAGVAVDLLPDAGVADEAVLDDAEADPAVVYNEDDIAVVPAPDMREPGWTGGVWSASASSSKSRMRRTKGHAPVRRMPQVGVLIETSLAAGRDMLAGIAEYVRRHEQWIIYMYPHDIDKPPPTWFRQWRCDGVIVRLHDARIAEAVLDKKKPVVDVLGVYDRGRYPLVHTDNTAIGRMAAEHFHQRGFISYGFFGLKDEYWSVERQESFTARVEEMGHTCASLAWSNRYERRSTLPDRMKLIGDWLRTLRLPAAIFVSDDPRALILRDAAMNAGFVTGRDIAILGVGDDRAFCEMPTPSLSSVDADHKRVGYEAAALLDAMMRGKAAPDSPVLVPPRDVVVRESTDFLAVPDEALQRALSFIRRHAVDGIGVDDVARACHMSRSVVQRRFREHLGQTIHDFILQEKTRHAIRLIRETNDSIENIARTAGFEYVQSLNKALRRLYGRSASDYRH